MLVASTDRVLAVAAHTMFSPFLPSFSDVMARRYLSGNMCNVELQICTGGSWIYSLLL
jgi:hypothetical protein